MSRIRVKNFGPVKGGLKDNDGWIEIKKVCVFIGDQGSGKSTVAKLISMLTWIEKAIVRGDFDTLSGMEFEERCAYQNIASYFKPNTSIEYQGDAYSISYVDVQVVIKKNPVNGYAFPKIMYVPAERNLVSAVVNVEELEGLTRTLYTFSKEYVKALNDLTAGQTTVPLKDYQVVYDKVTKIVYLKSDEFNIRLSEASSGFQSFTPLFLVSEFLANILERKLDPSKSISTIEKNDRLRNKIREIMSNPNLTDEIKDVLLEELSAQTKYGAFINIVEEPEQNLFPTSQREVLNILLEFNNQSLNNKLIITTHSPYFINYITLAVKASSIFSRNNNLYLLDKLSEIVPLKSIVSPQDLAIYEMKESDGTISKLVFYHGLPSDANYLNDSLMDVNEYFDKLISLELNIK